MRSRVAALFLGAAYLALMTDLFSYVDDVAIVVSAFFVIIGAVLIVASLGVFCVRLVCSEPGARRLKLSTLFLLFVPLSVYLAAISRIVESIRHAEMAVPDSQMQWFGWTVLSAYLAAFVVISTAILLWFGEAMVWLATRLAKASGRK